MAQMFCQSKLEELIADPKQLRKITDEPIIDHPDWTYSVEGTPTEIEGLVRLRVSVTKVGSIEKMAGVGGRSEIDPRSPRKVFELIRLTRQRSLKSRNDADFVGADAGSNVFSPQTTP